MSPAKNYVLNVLARDRVGIVAGVTEAIHKLDGNIDAMSQTVLRGYFTIIIAATFPDSVLPETVRLAAEATGEPGELAVSVKLLDPQAAAEPVVRECDQFVLSIMGRDRPGVIARISNFLSSRNINIVDLYAYAESGQFVLLSQVMVPRAMDVGQLQIDLENLWKKSDFIVSFQHENIFLATNRVDFRGTGG
ncbi:MAG TPA: ACT domain-containing protein [Candidatus Brocadiia bacterium]|nr:ACT domain-containing protein [Candidatus Brocadiia bacterium]